MRDISKEISHYTRKFSIACPQYSAGQDCKREGGCVCAKYGEIYALIHSLIKPDYRKATIYSFKGELPDGTQVMEKPRAAEIRKKMWAYLYGDAARKPQLDRSQLNYLSVLDRRFANGESLIIYGDSQQTDRNGAFHVKKHMPMGKTLLASIVMIDAMYRRAFPSNKAMTYDWISFLQLRQILKQKDSDLLIQTQESDWLVIDDLDIIDQGDHSRASAWTKEAFDAFLIDRIDQRKPTILVCNFDVIKITLGEKMGAAFEKIATSGSTHMIRV